jgi:hypothetical protein
MIYVSLDTSFINIPEKHLDDIERATLYLVTILIQRENSADHGVNETRRVSFAHQNAPRSGDGCESRKPGATVHAGLSD